MAVTPADLLAPTGDLLPEFFPGEAAATIEARLTGYLAEALTAASAVTDPATQDAIVRDLAYARAYGAIYVRLLHSPATVAVSGEVTAGRSATQIEQVRALRDEHRARAAAALATATVPAPGGPATVQSDTTTLNVSW